MNYNRQQKKEIRKHCDKMVTMGLYRHVGKDTYEIVKMPLWRIAKKLNVSLFALIKEMIIVRLMYGKK